MIYTQLPLTPKMLREFACCAESWKGTDLHHSAAETGHDVWYAMDAIWVQHRLAARSLYLPETEQRIFWLFIAEEMESADDL